MNTEQDFLIKYGLHNHVTSAFARGRRIFVIKNTQSQTMIRHAKHLIEGAFGPAAMIELL